MPVRSPRQDTGAATPMGSDAFDTLVNGAGAQGGPLGSSIVNLIACAATLAVLLAVTISVGATLRYLRSRPRPLDPAEVIEPHRLGADALGQSATLLQFSSTPSIRCFGVHRTLGSIAGDRDDVLHLDIDLTERPDIARHFHVLQTPTTLILDREGMVQTRFGGTPSRGAVELELARVTASCA